RDSLLGTGDTMENTIRRMTGATADRFMLKDRGYLKEGYYADLTFFSEDEIINAVPDREEPFGIRKVMINGKLVLDEGSLDAAALRTAGRAIPVL
ncbi:MAG: amidohydrolase family protein, partial [Firmicutes bacterium]|nr:amidohydrolase family protein [Bacillota bacterium]